ncbi:hypothetical protein MES4922_190295 [Mesorhizobium ventifaucium]|uniref:Uncharacterized protein n=1 Tax=Mesorhizobium ventifaucium TaxID=666020 RepID=A0ABM9DLQ1_9HYPH|nr:hypothetical protein MES4922_190295 [Mesorhizobium ventifaucium]
MKVLFAGGNGYTPRAEGVPLVVCPTNVEFHELGDDLRELHSALDRGGMDELARAFLRRAEGCADRAGHLRRPKSVRPEGYRSTSRRIPQHRQDGG